MPTYCYNKIPSGEPIELIMSVREMGMRQTVDKRILLEDGVWAERDYAREMATVAPTGIWPQYSDAMGVDPSQSKDAEKEADRIGVPTKFTKDGAAEFRSASHRRKYLKAMGYVDRSSYN